MASRKSRDIYIVKHSRSVRVLVLYEFLGFVLAMKV